MPKYVCLEGIKEGNRFYSMHEEGRDETKLDNGEVAYRILGYADTDDDARQILYPNETTLDRAVRFKEYLNKMPTKELGISDESISRLALLLALKP